MLSSLPVSELPERTVSPSGSISLPPQVSLMREHKLGGASDLRSDFISVGPRPVENPQQEEKATNPDADVPSYSLNGVKLL